MLRPVLAAVYLAERKTRSAKLPTSKYRAKGRRVERAGSGVGPPVYPSEYQFDRFAEHSKGAQYHDERRWRGH